MEKLSDKDADLITQKILETQSPLSNDDVAPPNFEFVSVEEGTQVAEHVTKAFKKTVTELAYR